MALGQPTEMGAFQLIRRFFEKLNLDKVSVEGKAAPVGQFGSNGKEVVALIEVTALFSDFFRREKAKKRATRKCLTS